MEREGHRGRGELRGHRGHDERPLAVELAQLLLDLYRVWNSLVALASRLGSRKEQMDEDSNG